MKDLTKERICQVIDSSMEAGVTSGVSLLVLKNGEELFSTARGYADLEKGIPLTRDHIFRLFSMSKPITAVAAMILFEEGLLDLGTPVRDILPGFGGDTKWFGDQIVPTANAATVHHLLNMTGGFSYDDPTTKSGRMVIDLLNTCKYRLAAGDPLDTQEFVRELGRIPLNFEPGSSWQYSFGADVLGAVVEQVSGMRFGQFLKQRIFDPLGMTHTGFYVPESERALLASAYLTRENGTLVPFTEDQLNIHYPMDSAPAFESGGAGLVSTLDDYARFAQMLLGGGRLGDVRILSERTARFLCSGRLTPPQQEAMNHWVDLEGFTYSHLMRRMQDPDSACILASPNEYGWDGWMGCYFANLPEEQLTIVLMQQKAFSGTIPMTRRIRNLILQDLD